MESFRLFFNPFNEAGVVLRVVDGAHPERFRVGLDCRQRRLQFVGYIGGEIAPYIFQFTKFCQVA